MRGSFKASLSASKLLNQATLRPCVTRCAQGLRAPSGLGCSMQQFLSPQAPQLSRMLRIPPQAPPLPASPVLQPLYISDPQLLGPSDLRVKAHRASEQNEDHGQQGHKENEHSNDRYYVAIGASCLLAALNTDERVAHAWLAMPKKPETKTPEPAREPCKGLHGKWKKQEEVGADHAMLMMGLNYIFRQAATLLSNMEIQVTEQAFQVTTSGGLVISIKETYPFSGEESVCNRRDNRSGKHVGRVTSSSAGKLELYITFDDPHGGEIIETFELLEDGNMRQTTNIKVNKNAIDGQPGEWYKYHSIFKRV